MKKLALALVCFASVAFMASCVKPVDNPEPTLALKTGENYVYDGQTIDIDTEYMLGFRAASNSQTLKELSTFKLGIRILELDGTEIDNADTLMNISGTEFVYDHVLNFTLSRELVGKAEITATVTDVDGKLCTTTINLNVNQPAQPLEAKDFTWYRHGANTAEGNLADLGLQWAGNSKESFVILKPLTGATLYGFTSEDWGATTTDVEKAALFSDGLNVVMDEFRGVSAWSDKDYDFVIGTVYNGEYHLIHITHGDVESKTDITITGQYK